MCISSAPSHMSGTRLYAAEAKHPVTGKYIHILGYQNKAENLSPQPNAMILPFPAAASMGKGNILDTTAFPLFLRDMATALTPRSRGLGNTKSLGSADSMNARSIEVFESGSYTVVLAENPNDIESVLERIPVNKRPVSNPTLFASFSELYPGQQVAVCCWDGKIEPEPLLWWYEPKDTETFFLPALDAHDGKPPHKGHVKVDHMLMFGSMLNPVGLRWWSTHEASREEEIKRLSHLWTQGSPDVPKAATPIPESLRPYLAMSVIGTPARGYMYNGDFFMPVSKMTDRGVNGLDISRIAPASLPNGTFGNEAVDEG